MPLRGGGKSIKMRPVSRPDLKGIKAFIFDLDGVLTDTATLHARAWKEVFDAVLKRHGACTGTHEPSFSIARDYPAYVDGRSRLDGIRTFLDSRGIELPLGTPEDAATAATHYGIAAAKNARYLTLLRQSSDLAFPDADEILTALAGCGIARAVFSASRNAREVLDRADLGRHFGAIVDGPIAERAGLDGKPAPDMLVLAARLIGASPDQAAVAEDSIAGLEAAHAGGFRLIVGVDRTGSGDRLDRGRPDVTVSRLTELIPFLAKAGSR